MIFTLKGGSIAVGGRLVGAAAAVSEIVLVVGGLSAAYYVGACIGSLAVATGKCLSGGISIADCLSTATSHEFKSHGWLLKTLITNPSILKTGKKVRHFSTPSSYVLVAVA